MIVLTDPSNGDVLALHPDLYWSDEDDWHPVAQNVARTLDGALDIQAQGMVSGRPITLRLDALENHRAIARLGPSAFEAV